MIDRETFRAAFEAVAQRAPSAAETGLYGAIETEAALVESLIADFGGPAARVATFYQIYYDRLPAAEGLGFWTGAVSRNPGFSDRDLAQAFFDAGEFTALYGDLSPADTVTALYRNVLGREPAPGGLAFWQRLVETPDNGFGLLELGFEFATALETVFRVGPRAEAWLGDLALGQTPLGGLFAYPGSDLAKSADAIAYDGGGAKETVPATTPAPALAGRLDGNAAAFEMIGLDAFRADPRLAGIDGTGLAVAVLDTGIDTDHPAFGPPVGGTSRRILEAIDFSDGSAEDTNGHGTLVASIIGSSAPGYPGVAPGVEIVALDGNVELALQWLVREAEAHGIVAVNMSFGYDDPEVLARFLREEGYNSPISRPVPADLVPIADELRALEAQGVILVAAAGNSYEFWQAPGSDFPAADPAVISVGALWDEGVPATAKGFSAAVGDIASFSQRGTADGMATVFAPGAFIEGAAIGGGVTANQGTSFSAPLVTGVAVLAQDLALETLGRRLTPFEFETLLRLTADPIADAEIARDLVSNTRAEFGRIDTMALAERILALAPAPPSPAPGDAVPGDASTTRALGLDAAVADIVDRPGDADWWRLPLEAGRAYVLTLEGAGSPALSDPILTLRDADGRIVGSDDDGLDGRGAELRLTARETGTFFAEARGVDGATGGYRLAVRRDDGADDLPADATTPSTLATGAPATGTLESEGDRDWHAIEVVAGARYEIRLTGTGAEPLFDPVLTLRAPDGTELGFSDDGDGLAPVLVFVADRTGTVHAEAAAFDDTGTGGYALALADLPALADVGADPGAAAPLGIGGTAEGALDFAGDSDWFAVTLTGGARYAFTLSGVDAGAGTLSDPLLVLRDGVGREILSDDDGGVGLGALIDFTAPSDGTYILEAAAFDPGDLGTYRLSARLGGEAGTDVPGSPASDASVFPGEPVTGVLEEPGDTDWYGTFLFAGESFVFTLEGTGPAAGALADPLLRLHDAEGTELRVNDDRAPGDLSSELRFTATEDMVVYLSAEAFDGGFAGAYRLEMIEAA